MIKKIKKAEVKKIRFSEIGRDGRTFRHREHDPERQRPQRRRRSRGDLPAASFGRRAGPRHREEPHRQIVLQPEAVRSRRRRTPPAEFEIEARHRSVDDDADEGRHHRHHQISAQPAAGQDVRRRYRSSRQPPRAEPSANRSPRSSTSASRECAAPSASG